VQSTEKFAREELHERLDRMLADVEDCIASQNSPEPQPPFDIELDEL
jgi:hypothetical protein